MSKTYRSGLTKSQRAIEKAKPIVERFELYSSGEANSHKLEIAKDIAFVNNAQWEESVALALEEANIPVTTNNEIKPVRDQVIGQITENNPRWLASPRENSDASIAGKVSDLASYIWDAPDSALYRGRMHFRTAVESCEDTGLFCLHCFYDPDGDWGKGEVRITSISPQEITISPNSRLRNAQDADHIFLSTILSEDEIRRRYSDFDFTDAIPYNSDPRLTTNQSVREGQVFVPQLVFERNKDYYRIIDDYMRIKMDMFWVYDPNSDFESVFDKRGYIAFANKPAIIAISQGEEQVITEEVKVRKYFKIMQTYGDTFFQYSDGSIASGTEDIGSTISPTGQLIYPVEGSTTYLKEVTMGNLLEEGKIKWQIVKVDRIKRAMVIGEKLHKTAILPISNYPFGITMLHHTGNPYCYGDARLARSVQEQINKINSIIIAYNINISTVRAFIQKRSMDKKDIEERWGKAGFQLFEYDSDLGNPPVIIQMTQMSNAFYQQLDRLRMLLWRIYGAYPEQEGQVKTPPQTLGGTLILDDQGLRRSASKLKLIEDALNDLGGVIAEMIPNVYSERKLIRILLPNGETRDVTFNQEVEEDNIIRIKNDLTANRFDIKIQSGSTLPSNRNARFGALLRMYELGALKNPTPLLRETDLPNIDAIIQGEDLINQAQQYIGKLEETIKTLEGDLQTASREKVHADQKALLAKAKADLDAIVARANAGEQLGSQRINDIVKNFKQQTKELLNEKSGTSNNASEPQGE